MNNYKKLTLALAVLMSVGICAFTACNNSGEGDTDDPIDVPTENLKTFVMESECVDFTGKSGVGMSSSATESEMIMRDLTGAFGASEGYYVSYTHKVGLSFEYQFTSDKDTTASLILRLASDPVVATSVDNYGSKFLSISINGTDVNYTKKFKLTDKFQDFVFTNALPVKEGDNELVLTVLNAGSGKWGSFETLGPLFDCVKIKSDAELSWEAIDNM